MANSEQPQPSADQQAQQVQVGTIVGVHGYDGRLRIQPNTHNPERFRPGGALVIAGSRYRIQRSGPGPGGQILLVKLAGLDAREEAAKLVREHVLVGPDDIPDLPSDTYYHYQLLDLRVLDTQDNDLGTITEIIETGSNDVYVVTNAESELMVPALADIVVSVDLDAGRMIVDLPEGIEPRALKPAKPKAAPRRRRRRPAKRATGDSKA